MFDKTLKQIAAAFGESSASVVRRIDRGELKYGVHYVDLRSPKSRKANYRFDLVACQDLYSIPPERR